MFKLLTSDRLLYRKLEQQDAKSLWDQMFNAYDKYKMYEKIKFASYSEFQQYIEARIYRYEYGGNYLRWVLEICQTNELIGSIDLHGIDVNARRVDICYYILPDYRRNGYASEAVNRVVNFAFTDMGYKTIRGCVDKGMMHHQMFY